MNDRSKSESVSTILTEPVDAIRRRFGKVFARFGSGASPGRWGAALCVLLACALTACGEGAIDQLETNDQPQTNQVAQPILSQVGIERVIPIRYYVLDSTASPCTTQVTDSQIYEGMRIANRTWQAAGIQFSVSGISRLNTPTFRDVSDSPAVSWASVLSEAQLINPALNSGSFPAPYPGPYPEEDWLQLIAERLPFSEIPVMIVCSDDRGGLAHASLPGPNAWPAVEPSHVVHHPCQRWLDERVHASS